MAIAITAPYYITNVFICSYVIFFFAIRLSDVLAASSYAPMYIMMMITTLVAISTLFTNPSITIGLWTRKLGLIALIAIHLKSELDDSLNRGIWRRNLKDSIVVVTGASSGIGKAVVNEFITLNATVIIGCRNVTKCIEIADRIHESTVKLSINETEEAVSRRVIPMTLDLNDLTSVKNFAMEVKKKYPRIDILVNNAGVVDAPVDSKTIQGLEESFGAMHIGHFALTKWLLDALQKHPNDSKGLLSGRIINVAALVYYFGYFHPSLLTGTGAGDLQGEETNNCPSYYSILGYTVSCCPFFQCPTTNGYARAKLANIFHAFELQKRLDIYNKKTKGKKRRVVTSSLHPGIVSSDLHPIVSNIAIKRLLRSPEQAANIILYAALNDNYLPGSYLDSMKYSHDFFNYTSSYLDMHITAFPATSNYPFVRDANSTILKSIWTVDDWLWKQKSFITDSTGNSSLYNNITAETVAARLYDVSSQIVTDFERKRKLFSTSVTKSTMKL